jgi:hypothetical protein
MLPHRPSPGGAAVALGLVLGCAACAHVAVGSEKDATLAAMERGFAALAHGHHAQARTRLAEALAAFDALALDGSALEKAFASDPDKPYRGRPHERTLTALTVAALDAEAGRCDMARASLKDAAYLHARDQRDTAGRAHDDVIPLAEAIARGCRGDAVTLVFRGHGPTFAATGTHAETLTLRDGDDHGTAGLIHIGAAASASSAKPAPLWSSTFEAAHVGQRPFAQVLAERARFKSER